MNDLRAALFPMRLGPPDLRHESEDGFVGYTLDAALHALIAKVRLELRYDARQSGRSEADVVGPAIAIVRELAAALPRIRQVLDSDVEAAFHGDPAARSVDEVLLCYPGIEAVVHHRIAHVLYRLGVPLIARLIAEKAHGETGIDIHPRAGAPPYIPRDVGELQALQRHRTGRPLRRSHGPLWALLQLKARPARA